MKVPADLRSLARQHTAMCVNVLSGIARSRGAPASARAFAASTLLDRGWGKAPQQVTGDGGGAINVIVRQIIDNADETEMKVIEHDPACDK